MSTRMDPVAREGLLVGTWTMVDRADVQARPQPQPPPTVDTCATVVAAFPMPSSWMPPCPGSVSFDDGRFPMRYAHALRSTFQFSFCLDRPVASVASARTIVDDSVAQTVSVRSTRDAVNRADTRDRPASQSPYGRRANRRHRF